MDKTLYHCIEELVEKEGWKILIQIGFSNERITADSMVPKITDYGQNLLFDPVEKTITMVATNRKVSENPYDLANHEQLAKRLRGEDLLGAEAMEPPTWTRSIRAVSDMKHVPMDRSAIPKPKGIIGQPEQ